MMHKLISGYESAIARIILNCLEEVYFPVSTKITMLILQGNPTSFIRNHQLNELETYPMLSNFTQSDLLTILDSLVIKDYAKLEHQSRYSDKPVDNLMSEGLNYISTLKLTRAGAMFLKSGENIYLGFLDKLGILKRVRPPPPFYSYFE